jgi:hypothetical protein
MNFSATIFLQLKSYHSKYNPGYENRAFTAFFTGDFKKCKIILYNKVV